MSGFASSVPDWDGILLPVNLQWFEAGHRVWGHNIFAILCVAALLAVTEYQLQWMRALSWWIAKRMQIDIRGDESNRVLNSPTTFIALALVAFVVQALHLVCDAIVSGGYGLPPWEICPWWPVTKAGYVLPLIPWGDPGPTVLLMGGLIYMAWRPQHTPRVAVATLVAVCAYVLFRGWFRGVLGI